MEKNSKKSNLKSLLLFCERTITLAVIRGVILLLDYRGLILFALLDKFLKTRS